MGGAVTIPSRRALMRAVLAYQSALAVASEALREAESVTARLAVVRIRALVREAKEALMSDD